jgi:osmotically inducible protein OsmC
MAAIYVAIASSHGGGRQGRVTTSDGKVALDLAYPKEIGGSGAGTNPEQLVAMGYAACFASALENVAKARHANIQDMEVTCRVSLNKEGEGFSLSFEIIVDFPSCSHNEAELLVQLAHQRCPYSRAFGEGAPTAARVGKTA